VYYFWCSIFIKNVEMERKDSLIKLRTCAVEQSFEHYDTWESATIISRIKSLS
jgi:hypothetical protein